ncbi:MAG: MFS transporter, partial [Pseudomonadota bacterium]
MSTEQKLHGFVAGLGVCQIISWGTLYYSFPLLAIPVAAEFGATKPQVYLAATIGLVVSSLCAYFVGASIDRGRGRIMLTFGSALGGILLIVWSQIDSLLALYVVFLGIGVALSMTLYEPGFAVIARRFGAQSRRGITNLTLWGGFASTVFIPITQWLLDQYDWRTTLIVLGAVNLVLGATIHFSIIDPRRDVVSSDTEAGGEALRNPVRWAMTQPVFWGLLFAFTIYYGVFGAMTFHLYPLLLERGFN